MVILTLHWKNVLIAQKEPFKIWPQFDGESDGELSDKIFQVNTAHPRQQVHKQNRLFW